MEFFPDCWSTGIFTASNLLGLRPFVFIDNGLGKWKTRVSSSRSEEKGQTDSMRQKGNRMMRMMMTIHPALYQQFMLQFSWCEEHFLHTPSSPWSPPKKSFLLRSYGIENRSSKLQKKQIWLENFGLSGFQMLREHLWVILAIRSIFPVGVWNCRPSSADGAEAHTHLFSWGCFTKIHGWYFLNYKRCAWHRPPVKKSLQWSCGDKWSLLVAVTNLWKGWYYTVGGREGGRVGRGGEAGRRSANASLLKTWTAKRLLLNQPHHQKKNKRNLLSLFS